MSKIILIGCPGSGKSTLAFKLEEKLKYPVLHLDKIYHIDNNNHIARQELIERVDEFAKSHKNWIIDGNYISTVEQRINLSDVVILLDVDTKICVQNAINRSKKERTADMAEGFDNSQVKAEFIEFISAFKTNTLPKIMELLKKYEQFKKIVILKNYEEVDKFLNNIDVYL